MTKRQAAWRGMNWIRQEKRLAIYLRDGAACVWCAAGVEDAAVLELDHLRPHANGGGNEAANLVTACKRCNASRGKRGVTAFAVAVAAYLNHGIKPAEIVRHIRQTTRRALPMAEAKALIARRGSAARALRELK